MVASSSILSPQAKVYDSYRGLHAEELKAKMGIRRGIHAPAEKKMSDVMKSTMPKRASSAGGLRGSRNKGGEEISEMQIFDSIPGLSR